MKIKTTNRSKVKEYIWGVYVWETPDGQILGDGDGNVMLVYSTEGDPDSIKAITEAAAHYGFPEGKAVYWSGKRPISDSEYEMQMERARNGLVPDPFDTAAIKEEYEALKQNERR